MIDNCYPRNGNTVGIAYLKSLCTAYNTGVSYCTGNRCDGIWLTLAHEVPNYSSNLITRNSSFPRLDIILEHTIALKKELVLQEELWTMVTES